MAIRSNNLTNGTNKGNEGKTLIETTDRNWPSEKVPVENQKILLEGGSAWEVMANKKEADQMIRKKKLEIWEKQYNQAKAGSLVASHKGSRKEGNQFIKGARKEKEIKKDYGRFVFLSGAVGILLAIVLYRLVENGSLAEAVGIGSAVVIFILSLAALRTGYRLLTA